MNGFGSNVSVASFVVTGQLSQSMCATLTDLLIERIGMTVAYPPAVFDYPKDGKGGVGFTYFQTITESFLVWDVWPKLDGAYLMVCSCKPFDSELVKSVILSVGLTVKSAEKHTMEIADHD